MADSIEPGMERGEFASNISREGKDRLLKLEAQVFRHGSLLLAERQRVSGHFKLGFWPCVSRGISSAF